MLIDTHCHLDDERFDVDIEKVIKNSLQNGLQAFINAGANPKDLPKAQKLAKIHKNLYFAAGYHPIYAQQYNESILQHFVQNEKCKAIGECGLDYYWLNKSGDIKAQKKTQQEVFIAQINLAKKTQLPLIIHIRDSNEDSLAILKNEKAKNSVLHCFNGSEILLELLDNNFYYGVGGVITFKNAKKLPQIIKKIPLERLVIETDAPYLTPHPHRGKRNEPIYIRLICEKLAEIFGISYQEIANITTQNAQRLFLI